MDNSFFRKINVNPFIYLLSDKEYRDEYKFRLIQFSSDSTKAIDLYSCFFFYQDEHGKTVAELESDSRIIVVDIHKKQQSTLFTFGPDAELQSAFWVNNKDFFFTYTEKNEFDLYVPFFGIFQECSKEIALYKVNGIKGIKEVDFLKRIFKDIEILDYP